MSDVSQGPGWWQASDGKWYPPKDADKAPAPGWWLASDGKWYPPVESEQPPQPGWWLAADGKWYPPADSGTEAASGAAKAPAKPVAAKPVAAKPVAAKPVAAKPVAAKPTPAKAASAKPAPAKPAAAKQAPAKPAGAKPAPAKSAAPAAAPSRESDDVRRSGFGMSPEEQIRIRNEASKRDAQALAAKRSMAATRALSTLQGMIDDEKASQSGQDLHESRALRGQPAAPPPAAKPAPPAKSAAKSVPAPKPAAPPPPAKAAAPAPPAKAAAPAAPAPPAAAPAQADAEPRVGSADSPLLEVKQSPLHSDIDHLGERLVIFTDRVELHDRNDRVRETIFGPDIADVVVHKKFTGSTVTVESGTGVTIVAKGLKPDQAEEIRALILKRTRQGTTSATDDAVPAKPASTGKPGAAAKPAAPKAAAGPRGTGRNRVNQEELLAKLTDLHRAGVLTDDELEEKKALVARLARGETLASSTPS